LSFNMAPVLLKDRIPSCLIQKMHGFDLSLNNQTHNECDQIK